MKYTVRLFRTLLSTSKPKTRRAEKDCGPRLVVDLLASQVLIIVASMTALRMSKSQVLLGQEVTSCKDKLQ